MSGRRSANTIRACGDVAARQGRIHDRKTRYCHCVIVLAIRGWSIHIILLQQKRSDEAGDGVVVWKDPHHVRSPLDFAVETLNGICGVELDAMLLGKAHVGQNVVLCFIHNGRELGYLRTDLIGNRAPLGASGLRRFLGKGGDDEGRDHAPPTLAGMGQDVAHKMHSRLLPGRRQHIGHGGLYALVGIGDDQLGATQSPPRQFAQEGCTDRLSL